VQLIEKLSKKRYDRQPYVRQGVEQSIIDELQRSITKRMKEPFLKRPFDIVLAGVGLLLSLCLWACIWIAILVEDGYPVLIKQRRIGKDGKLFTSLKFRSMVKSSLNERVNVQAEEDDPRITWVGRILRKTAFDELPQLLSILTGDMSFVGPRPLLPREVELNGNDPIHIEHIPGYGERIKVRPGLTGIAQVYAPRDLPRRYKFKYDLLYIRKTNFLLDIQIILLSFLVTFIGKWEKRGIKLEFLKKH
jgi:lipopolysaccharide/colanic/teichoic acid biosynthesis glycosyltransferase